MKKIEFIAGDFELRKWKLDNDILKTGKYMVQQIPIRDIAILSKEEEVGRTVYVEAVLGTGQSFKAVMSRGAYKALYASFIRFGNDPINNELPLCKKSITEFFFAAVALLLVLSIFINSDDSENNEAIANETISEEQSSTPTTPVNSYVFTEKDKVELCKAYIASLFYKPVSIIRHDRTDSNGLVYVEYIRKDDNTLWEQVCKVEQDSIIWSAWLKDTQEWGRWRSEDRVKFHYDDQNNAVTFTLPGYESSVSVPLAN